MSLKITENKLSIPKKGLKKHIRFSVRHPLLIGHYTVDDRVRRMKLKSVHDVARFICEKGSENGNLLITTENKQPFITTFGMYLNRIEDMSYRAKLLKILIPMQLQVECALTVKDL